VQDSAITRVLWVMSPALPSTDGWQQFR